MKQKIAIGIIALAVLSLFGFVLFRLIPKINSVNKKEFVGTGHPGWPPITWQNNDELIGAGPDLMISGLCLFHALWARLTRH
jgi:hypothetical protein